MVLKHQMINTPAQLASWAGYNSTYIILVHIYLLCSFEETETVLMLLTIWMKKYKNVMALSYTIHGTKLLVK